jgi:drug/metabolite transporter (DMT)-like permease
MPDPASPQSASNRSGILLMVRAFLFFSLMDSTAKGLVANYPAPMVFGARFAGMVLIVPVTLRGRITTVARTRFVTFHLLRSALQFGATACFFASLSSIGLAKATAITDTAPELITLLVTLLITYGGRPLF